MMTRDELQKAYNAIKQEREDYTGDDVAHRSELRHKMESLSEQLEAYDRGDM